MLSGQRSRGGGSGTETLAIGLAAAGIAWLIGHLLKEAFLYYFQSVNS